MRSRFAEGEYLEMGLPEKGQIRADDRLRLTEGERVILLLLTEIQDHLKLESSSRANPLREAIVSGNLWSIEEHFPEVFDNMEITKATANEVREVLAMWQRLEESFSRLSPTEKEWLASTGPQGQYVKFIGFSENYEPEQSQATRFLVNATEQFSYFKGRELNSHVPMSGQYRRMLPRFTSILDEVVNRDFSAPQLHEVLSA
jgi:uncharacterized protein YfbU (UPF0304 family)